MEEKQIVDFEILGDQAAQEALKNTSHSIEGRATVHVIPQSHLDLMWKWDRHDIREMIHSTFLGHVELLEANPGYTYSQSQLFLYEYVRVHFPELFERIQALVAQGRWEITGGQWVEADNNLPDDESTVRQFLIGQRYALRHFGVAATAGWCQDAFGTNANMPQVLRQAGLRLYVHKRPRHRFQALPSTPYLLQGADGTRICALRANNKGIGLPRVSEGEPFEGTEIEHIHARNAELGISDLWGPLGCGDTGGVNDYHDVPAGRHLGLEFKFSTPEAFYDAIGGKLGVLPVVSDEINFEFPACYTTHADIKQANRLCERLLNMAEFLCSIRYVLDGEYPDRELDGLWKLLLYNQFHDGITGTGLDRVHEESMRDYAHIRYVSRQLIASAADAIGRSIDTSGFERPYILFNPNAFEQDTVVCIGATISRPGKCFVLADGAGMEFPGEIVSDELLDGNGNYHRLSMLFHVRGIPACGWLVLGLEQREAENAQSSCDAGMRQIENRFYRVCIDGQGQISELVDKDLGKQINKKGDAFACMQLLGEGKYALDYGRPHKAWNFGFDGTQKEIRFLGSEIVEDNAIRTVLRQRFLFGQSSLTRDIMLHHSVKKLEFKLLLDWQEVEEYLGVVFPLELGKRAEFYHRVPFALVQRDRREECPSLNYLAAKDGQLAFALMTEDRYGFSRPEANTVRLSLIHCSTDYDNRSDKGMHEFSFAVTTGKVSEFESIVRRCEEYRQPAQVCEAERHSGSQPCRAHLIDTGTSGILVSAVKKLEEGEGLAVRLFNPFDWPVDAEVEINIRCEKLFSADLLEQAQEELTFSGSRVALSFRRHEFKTLLLHGIERKLPDRADNHKEGE